MLFSCNIQQEGEKKKRKGLTFGDREVSLGQNFIFPACTSEPKEPKQHGAGE